MADRVDIIIEEWRRRRPDLDTSPLEIVARVLRASHYLQQTLDDVAAAYGLSHQGDLDVLADLYRVGPDRGLTPTELAGSLLLTSGGMTVRLHRLQRAGLIARTPNPDDGRGVLVHLTPDGMTLAEHALSTLFDAQADSVRNLAEPQLNGLTDLLRALLEALGDVPPFRPSVAARREHAAGTSDEEASRHPRPM